MPGTDLSFTNPRERAPDCDRILPVPASLTCGPHYYENSSQLPQAVFWITVLKESKWFIIQSPFIMKPNTIEVLYILPAAESNF